MLYIYCEATKHMHMVISLYRSVMETEDPRADNVIDVWMGQQDWSQQMHLFMLTLKAGRG